MEDEEFLRRFRARIEESAGRPITLRVDPVNRGSVSLDFSGPVPQVTIGADALKYPGLARLFLQYCILCLREGRSVDEHEFLLFLRRN